MSNIEWTGNLEDDCCATSGNITAHCEVMIECKIVYNGDDVDDVETAALWWASVCVGEREVFNSSVSGGTFTSGALARSVCEAIMLAHVALSSEVRK